MCSIPAISCSNSDQLPESVLCVGGGAIGVELGFFMHQFGSRVCIVEQGARLLNQPQISERASNLLERKFKRIGIEVRKHTAVTASRHVSDGVEVTFSDGRRETFHKVLVAVGRKPASSGLGLEEAGIRVDADGFIEVTEYLETCVPGIYAIGDVKEGPMTANAALHDAKVATSNAINGNAFNPNYYKVPVVINSAFEIAAVGLTEEQAEAAGFTPDVARASFGGSGKARAHHDFEGFIEVVHDEESGQLLGGCIVGPEAGEQIHMMTAACQSERGLWFFKDLSYSHPSWCEELETAIDPYTSAYSRAHGDVVPGIYATPRRAKKMNVYCSPDFCSSMRACSSSRLLDAFSLVQSLTFSAGTGLRPEFVVRAAGKVFFLRHRQQGTRRNNSNIQNDFMGKLSCCCADYHFRLSRAHESSTRSCNAE